MLKVIDNLAALLNQIPEVASLSPEAQEAVLRFSAMNEYSDQIRGRAKTLRLDYGAIKGTFLDSTHSEHTRTAYGSSFLRLEQFCAGQGIAPLELTPLQADTLCNSRYLKKPMANGIIDDCAPDRSPASICRDFAAFSSFFTYVERVTSHTVMNPFRGSRARPRSRIVKELAIPSADELAVILDAFPAHLSAAVALMAFRGLRVGGLQNIAIDWKSATFATFSKGKEYRGHLAGNELIVPQEQLLARMQPLKAQNGGYLPRGPFRDIATGHFKSQVQYHMQKLCRAGRISAVYSCHDFRHYYAVTHYCAHKDIYLLRRLLNHSSIQTTEKYLRALNLAV